MADEPGAGGGKANFFTTLPGILTGVAAVLTAAGTLAGVLIAGGNNDNGGQTQARAPTQAASTTVEAGPSLDEWSRLANAACRRRGAEIADLGNIATPEEAVAASGRVVQAGLGMVEEVRSMEPPPAEEERIDRMLDLWGEAFRTVDAAIQAAVVGDAQGFAGAYARAANAADEADAIARDLGADACLAELEQ